MIFGNERSSNVNGGPRDWRGNRIKVKAERFRVANNNELKIGPRAICEFSGINWLVIRITTYFIDKKYVTEIYFLPFDPSALPLSQYYCMLANNLDLGKGGSLTRLQIKGNISV